MDDTARALEMVTQLLREYIRPAPRQTITEWAEQNRYLSAKDSAEPGLYRVARTPYVREPQDALSLHSAVSKVVLMWGAQTGKSTIGMNWLGYIIDRKPGPMMLVQPTVDTAKRFSRQRVAPMIEESPSLKSKVKTNRSRDEANTILLKEYTGGFLILAGANSAAGLRSMPIRDMFLDEVDSYPRDVDGEGDPIDLATARQTTFANRKQLITSTPTITDASRVEDEFLSSDQRHYHVACPHCGEYQPLEFGDGSGHGLRWHKDDQGTPLAHTAYYVCKASGCEIREHSKSAMLEGGKWIAHNPAGKHLGYHLSSLYSPLGWLSWAEIVHEWLAAVEKKRLGDHEKIKTFVNTRLAKTYKIDGTGADAHILSDRAEPYTPGTAPLGVLMITMGVDVQGDRLEARVWGYGRGEEAWLIERHLIYGNPTLAEGEEGSPWSTLTKIRNEPIKHAFSGLDMTIESTAIDTGGHHTNEVYQYARAHAHSGVIAVKGSSLPNKPILGKASVQDVTWRGRLTKNGVKMWMVGTDTAKDLLIGRMRLSDAGAGYMHVPDAYKATDEFEQMTAERRMPVTRGGKVVSAWVKKAGKRNEAMDCMVYAYAAACKLGIQTMRDPGWDRREQAVAPLAPKIERKAKVIAAPKAPQSNPPPLEQVTPATPEPVQKPSKPARSVDQLRQSFNRFN